MRNRNEIHDFYCIKCGNKVLSLPRQVSHQYKKHHMKKLWCYKCKCEINCVECKNDQEAYDFREKWLAGDYLEAVEESLKECNNGVDNL